MAEYYADRITYGGNTYKFPAIDDSAGSGATGKTWSADKIIGYVGGESESLQTQITSLSQNKANNSVSLSLTAVAGSWSSATPPTQTISATGVTESNNIIVGLGSGITAAQYEAACDAKIVCTAQGAGTITLTAYGDKPTENIPISVLIEG